MERAAPKGGPVIGSAWTALLDQRLAVLGVTHRKLAAHAARGQKTRALGQHILGSVAQFREEREDLFLGAVADGFQRFLAGVKRLGFSAFRDDDLVAVKEEVEIFHTLHVLRDVDALDLQELLGGDQNLGGANIFCAILERTRMRCCGETSRSRLGRPPPSAPALMRIGRMFGFTSSILLPSTREPIQRSSCKP